MGAKKRKFSDRERVHFQELLEARRRELLPVEEDLEREGLTDLSAEGTDEISSARLHPADLATEEFERDLDLDVAAGEIREIQDIEDALVRLQNDRYGICESCGKEIELNRLEALPYTRFCGECERRFEKRAREIREAHQGGSGSL